MKVTLTLPDDLAADYQTEADSRHLDLETVLVGRLKSADELDPRQRYLIIVGRVRDQLEAKLGGGHLQNANDLFRKVDRLAKIKFGEHEIVLTAGQLEELVWRSEKIGKSIDRMLAEMWQRISQEFFSNVS